MELNIILFVLAAIASLTQGQSYRYGRYSRRRLSRPASRLFGSNRQSSSLRSRYDAGRRPASRRFSIPGFESAFGTPSSSSSSNFQNLGFNLGFGGPAFVDPIAGMYETVSMQDGGGGGLGQASLMGVNDFAANTRSSFSREANKAMDPSAFSSRQQQNNVAITTHDTFLGGGGLGLQGVNLGFNGNQDVPQFLTAPGNNGGFTTLDLTSAAANQQMDLSSLRSQINRAIPTQNPLGAAQLNGMGSVQFIDASGMGGDAMGIDLTGLGSHSAGLQALNRLDMASATGLMEANDLHSLMSGHKALQNELGIDASQLGLENKHLGLGQNNILLDSNSLSNSLGLDGSHIIIQGEQMDMPKLGQSALSAGNQLLMDPSGGEMKILGNQISLGMGNGQNMLNSNQLGGDLSQLTGNLNAASALQGQMLGLSAGDGGSTQIVTSGGDFPGGSLTSQMGLGSSNQFFATKEEELLASQSKAAGQMAAAQAQNGLLSQLTGGA